MKLKKLELTNFQGIREFQLDAQGQDVSIFGMNAAGKTTIANSFMWLLFGKNLEGRADFEVKTLDEKGEPIHNLEHSVEATFDLDGKELALSRTLREKWTKKRGSATQTFSGHETDFKIDLVPVKKNEYEDRIASIVDESVFKLVTSPTFFNEQLHWQKRRETLLDVCGDITDDEVIATDKKLAKLPEILNGRALEDHRKVLAAKRAEINKELTIIPVRISEVSQGLPVIDGGTAELKDELAQMRERQQVKRDELSRVQAGGAIAEKTKELREIEGELIDIKNTHNIASNEKEHAAQGKLVLIQRTALEIKIELGAERSASLANAASIISKETLAAALREKWHAVNAGVLEIAQADTCYACGQTIPEAALAESKDKALAAHSLKKAEELADIRAQGQAIALAKKTLADENTLAQKHVEGLEKQLASLEADAEKMEADIELIRASATDIAENEAYQVALAKREVIEAEIEQLKRGNADAVEAAKAKIQLMQGGIDELEEAAARIEQHTRGNARIKELTEQEELLATEYESLEEQLFLTEEFTRTKVAMLDERINAKFKLARFKMFETQVNGGLSDVCETTFGGVTYSSLNNGARINTGLDIINTLAEHYGFDAPIFVDNAEAVTQLSDTRGQLIRLVVSGADKKLRVEVKEAAGGGLDGRQN